MPRLDIRRAQRISVHEISDDPVRVGRLSDNDLVLRNIHVSRHHCVIERFEDKIRVRDLDSQSGTFVNGDRVNEAYLFAGDRISVGPFDLVMRPGPDESGFISRNAALDAAMTHVHIDEDTGVSVEGPAALVESLRSQLDSERRQHRQAIQDLAGLRSEVDELRMRLAQSERSALLADDLPLPGEDRLQELEQALVEAQQRAEHAERLAEEIQSQAAGELDSLRSAAETAESRASELVAELDALRRETVPSSAAEQIAEIQGLLDIERCRARTAELQVERTAARLAEAERLSEAADRAGELQALLETERERADSTSAHLASLEKRLEELTEQRAELESAADNAAELDRALESHRREAEEASQRAIEVETGLQSQLSELRSQREADLQRIDELRTEIETLESRLRETRASTEVVSADHHAALQQLQEAEASLSQWRERGEQAERTLETERAHAADLNRALEEAWAKIDEAGANIQSLEARVEELETASQQQAERAAEALAEHIAEIERLTSTEASLRSELDAARQEREEASQSLNDLREKLATAESSLHHALARASELENVTAELRDRLAAMEQDARSESERLAGEIAARDKRIADLAASEENHRQRLNNLEATKFAASQKAERALGTLNLLHHQIRSLDDAAAKVTNLQSRLAQIEEAWVAADETLETVDESDETQLAAAVEQRQRIIAELDALNKARDAAVSSLRESALRLRSISERETPVVTTNSQAPEQETAGDGASGKRWWRRSK